MESTTEEVLEELSNDQILEYIELYQNVPDIEDVIFVPLYLICQLNWNRKMRKMSEHEVETISVRCKQKFYKYKKGNAKYATIIGITGENDYKIFLFTMEKSLDELRVCLMNTKLIKWKLCPLLTSIHKNHVNLLCDIIAIKGLEIVVNNDCSCIYMEKDKTVEIEDIYPQKDVIMKELSPNDSTVIDREWPYAYAGSEFFIESLIKLNGGLGIYSKENDTLLSWVLQIECNGMGLLQTKAEAQGKGYARILIRELTKKIGRESDVILFASHSKPKTVELYLRYGFKVACYSNWIYLRNKNA